MTGSGSDASAVSTRSAYEGIVSVPSHEAYRFRNARFVVAYVPFVQTPPTPPADTDPPETTIIKKPGKKITGSKTTIKFTSDEAGSSFQCALDKKPFSPCTSPKKLKGLRPGKRKFQVRAADPAGNIDPTPVGVKFTVAKPKK